MNDKAHKNIHAHIIFTAKCSCLGARVTRAGAAVRRPRTQIVEAVLCLGNPQKWSSPVEYIHSWEEGWGVSGYSVLGGQEGGGGCP